MFRLGRVKAGPQSYVIRRSAGRCLNNMNVSRQRNHDLTFSACIRSLQAIGAIGQPDHVLREDVELAEEGSRRANQPAALA